MKLKKYGAKSGFTLVELIVVIAILGILSVLGFVGYKKYVIYAKNSSLMSNLILLNKSLVIHRESASALVLPDFFLEISGSGETLGYQGFVGTGVFNTYKISLKSSSDFVYSLSKSRTNFKLGTLIYDDDNSQKKYVVGDGAPILYISGNILPAGNIDLLGSGATVMYDFVSDEETVFSASGVMIFGKYKNISASQHLYNSPSSCPKGFIPVPGNKKLSQPGFCVSQYEARPSNSLSYSTLPSVSITQSGAIAQCQSLGVGYHLIYDNEWLTIAENVFEQGENWTSGIVGQGALYQGHTDNVPSSRISDSSHGTDFYNQTGNSTSSGNTQKRTLKLSNGSIIWDFSGNVREHVDKFNDNSLNLQLTGLIKNNDMYCGSTPLNWFEVKDCLGYKYFSKGSLDSSNGLGQVYAGSGDILMRGGHFSNGNIAGIYTFNMNMSAPYANNVLGFRCAY